MAGEGRSVIMLMKVSGRIEGSMLWIWDGQLRVGCRREVMLTSKGILRSGLSEP